MINYDSIKQLAKEHGLNVADLCALAPKNDPFYTGRPAEVIAAEWFAGLWHKFGYSRGVHLRRVHYQIVSQNPPVERPDGSKYENTETCWDYLNEAAKWARYLHLVSPAAFVDRRNPEAVVNAYWPKPGDWNYEDPTPGYTITELDDSDYELPDLPELPGLPNGLPDLPNFVASGYEGVQQAYHVEVWCEKTTMNDVLAPLCRSFGVNLVTGAGELSITAVVDFMRRAQDAQRPARVLYISDFDPAGLGMPISVARKIEYFQRNEGFHDLDIRLQPLVLTTSQVEQYNLPRVPVKDTDLRKTNFEAAYGQGQVELDALEALYPGELARIVRKAILQYYDLTLAERAREQRNKLIDALDEEQGAVRDDYAGQLDELLAEYAELWNEFETTREEFTELVRDFQPKIDAYKERLNAIKAQWRDVYGDFRYSLGVKDFDLGELFPLPEPELPEEPDSSLYDSRRDYLAQLQAYKAQRLNIGAVAA